MAKGLSYRAVSKSPFLKALTVRQVGGEYLRMPSIPKYNTKTKFVKIGGGIFTERETVRSRLRFAETRGMKVRGLGKSSLRM